MGAEQLSRRRRQPGDDRSFERSESLFIQTARAVLDPEVYDVVAKPRELAAIFPARVEGERALGVVPEAMIVHRGTGRRLFVEVKKQGDVGNADERACKHHTVRFTRLLKERYGYEYHPFVTIFCESLATNRRYTRKAEFFFEPGQYLNWVDYDENILRNWLTARCAAWLADPPR